MLNTQQNFLVQLTGLSKKKKTAASVLIFTLMLFFISEGIELNSGYNKTNSSSNFSICNWNLNSAAACSFEEVGLFEMYNTINIYTNKSVFLNVI